MIMIKTSKTIIFFGTDNFSLVALQGLIDSNYDIAAVVTKPDSKSGRGQKLKMPSVKILAEKHGIKVWQPNNVASINSDIVDLNKATIGVLVSYGRIIPQSTIDLFTPGIINVHPSLLPKYRGSTPIESAIANGDEQTGVSIMKLISDMDAGPVYEQVFYELSGKETSAELYDTLASIGTIKLIGILQNIIDGSIMPTAQNNSQATYCKLLDKSDSQLQPINLTANEAERKIRAHLNFPKTKFNLLGKDIIITKAHVSIQRQSPADILCKDGNYLSIDTLIAPSGRQMPSKDFLNGHRSS